MEYNDYEHLTVDVGSDGVAVVTIDRPDRMNAVNHRLHREFVDIWRDLDRDAAVRVIVVTGAGDRAFSAGMDLDILEARMAMGAEERFAKETGWEARDLVYSIVNSDKIIIAAINGVAVGAGVAVALTSDISIMAEDAKIGDGHIRLGVVAGDHSAMLWPLLCGMAKAKYYLLTGEMITGREAAELGLVTKAVPRTEVLPTALDLARRFARGPQPALSLTKRALNQWLRLGAIVGFEYSMAAEKLTFFSPDAQAGVAALRSKTAPVFPTGARPPSE